MVYLFTSLNYTLRLTFLPELTLFYSYLFPIGKKSKLHYRIV